MSDCRFVDGACGGRSLDPWCETHERSASRCVEYLRTDLATVTAERDQLQKRQDIDASTIAQLSAAHAETRKALDDKSLLLTNSREAHCNTIQALDHGLVELAKAEARAKATTEAVQAARTGAGNNPHWQGWERILEALRG